MSSLANRAELDRWGAAAERLQEDTRKDPVGGTGSPDVTSEMGLVIQGVETGGRIHRDGRILVGDRIYEINGRSLHQVNFQQAQEVFKEALAGPELRLGLVRGLPLPAAKPPLEKGVDTKYATISSTRRVADTLCHNTRKIGRVLRVRLCKGPDGLGFSVTSRDNTSVPSPVYIRNILQQGAAVVDGRLQSGDRLLEVNGVGMTGKSQSEVVAMLRATPQGGTVDLVVSRQDPLPIIPLNIPLLPESGLGISITGKIYGDAEDLGLFVKDLIPGGSAHKNQNGSPKVGHLSPADGSPVEWVQDGKLRPNDQLVAIEGTSLLSMSNQEAMETLRNFLESRPKSIHLRVSRHPDMSSSEDSSQDQSSSANNTVIYMGRDELAVPGPNPVLERLTGGGEPPRHLGATDKADATIVSQ
ncbi:PARD3 [Cordylochernes scorpioides]|uniref:PARD3 n=1 Tax=Cordylochernes scorpioides TaxID=51811 RepID=A0ABY6KEY3_9ARAC|nr:PARD3 [Cordylochernes scorpioides]